MKWQIYGQTANEGSWARVTAGLEEGLLANGEEVSVFATDDVGHHLNRPLPVGFNADVGVFVGHPGHATMLRTQGNHKHRLLMIAPNSTWLPRDVLTELERTEAVTGYLTPSAWGADVLGKYTELPIHIWQHGVHANANRAALAAVHNECTRPDPEGPLSRSPSSWRCLHLSSTQQDRKSTHALVEQFVLAVEPEGKFTWLPEDVARRAKLTVIVDGPLGDIDGLVERVAKTDRGRASVEVLSRVDFSPAWMSHFMTKFDCVVQPSRAEGFGMVPLEARAAGVPVIMTDSTGHNEHVPRHDSHEVRRFGRAGHVTPEGVVVIHTGSIFELIDDGPDARAPTVDPTAIAAALEVAASWRHVLRPWAALHAHQVARDWNWEAVTRKFLRDFIVFAEGA